MRATMAACSILFLSACCGAAHNEMLPDGADDADPRQGENPSGPFDGTWTYVSGTRIYTCVNGKSASSPQKGGALAITAGADQSTNVTITDDNGDGGGCTIVDVESAQNVISLSPPSQVCLETGVPLFSATYDLKTTYTNFTLTTADGATMTASIKAKVHVDDGSAAGFDCTESASGALKRSDL